MRKVLLLLLLMGWLSGCASKPTTGDARLCTDGLAIAEQELEVARAGGLSGTVHFTRAVSLLGAAKVQREFGKYPNCIDKVERARRYISLLPTAQ